MALWLASHKAACHRKLAPGLSRGFLRAFLPVDRVWLFGHLSHSWGLQNVGGGGGGTSTYQSRIGECIIFARAHCDGIGWREDGAGIAMGLEKGG